MSYPNQYPPPNQYGVPPQPQWGQPPQAYGGYPPPGAPPPQQGGYPPYGGAPGFPAPSPQPGGYPGPPPQSGGYGPPPGAPPPQPGGYAPLGVPPPPQHEGYHPSYMPVPPGGPPAVNQATRPGQPYTPPASAPPSQPYGAPPGQPYSAPPAQPYGAPPQPYGSPAPPQPYGGPPQQAPYGASQPQQSYGGYAPPPMQQGPPRYLGVPIPPPPPAPPMLGSLPGFDANRTSDAIRKAMKGFGTDEKALTAAIAPLDAFQVDAVRRTFEATTGKNLVKAIEKETSSWYENCLRAKILGPVLYDCWLIRRACDGAGTHEDILSEVLLDRTNDEMQVLKAAYQATYGRDLASTIRSELSAKTERLFNMALVGNREESEYVDRARVEADMEALYKAGEGQLGTDEITICGIIVTRSPAHLRALAQAYPQKHKRKLSKAIDREFSGHMDTALQYVASGAEDDGYGVQRDADLLQDAMRGIGTKDERLIYRTIRAHWNRPRFEAIKQAYQRKYGKTLVAQVRSETGGDYREFMAAVIGNRSL